MCLSNGPSRRDQVYGRASETSALVGQEKSGWQYISTDSLLENIKVLASDEFEGRAPASKGETLTVGFLEEQFKKLGLKAGNPDGTYLQNVPMVGITADPTELVFTERGPADAAPHTLALEYGSDFVAWTKRVQDEVRLDSDLVFVGYGVVAPEYRWDDYKGVDVRGNVLVMLINDPPVRR